ncbi:thiamine pyrophosphate-dependent enzyme [Pseudomonas sp. NPDC047963]|jgi:hypothetical protein
MVALARAYGARVARVERTEAFAEAFEQALAADRPYLIEVVMYQAILRPEPIARGRPPTKCSGNLAALGRHAPRQLGNAQKRPNDTTTPFNKAHTKPSPQHRPMPRMAGVWA